MSIPRVKVVNPNEGWIGTEYYIAVRRLNVLKALIFELQLTSFRCLLLKPWEYRI